MESLGWDSSMPSSADDVLVSDNLLEFVKDEDLVKTLSSADDIISQGEYFNHVDILNDCHSTTQFCCFSRRI